ncbi:ABC transporter permease [Paenilisteria rocourtiae]|uniref:ABC-2 type transport system permease protein n=1 Tax=Listeria rocourtiae TaxID=647910 RepID=A0A4R6ZGU1_9LIST|nr:ABC transporter permease [Listeria rocourtiae]EUJ44206.1 putative ABC transporter permease [Listeria rocourtiae FSL F6-920]MBC1436570.1 ABC transporter permease [Listeria rocourtiae]MBC1605633.1 ABC transporter permease [Listeria rocourtiae]TDR51355.1 hypothetical protein DFP96_11346 [Listeria rocourtiae]
MKNILAVIKQQLSYQLKARYFFVFLIVVVFLCSIASIFQVAAYKESVTTLTRELGEVKKSDSQLDLDDFLKQDVNVTYVDGGGQQVDNYIKYDFSKMVSHYNALQPLNAFNQFFTSIAFVFFQLMIGIYGLFLAYTNIKYSTDKFLIMQYGKASYFFGQIIAGMITIGVVLVQILICAPIIQRMVNLLAPVKTPYLSYVPINQVVFVDKLPMELLTMFAIGAVYVVCIYCFTTLLKNQIIPLLTIFVYVLILPKLGTYDFKNIILYSIQKNFNTSAASLDMVPARAVNMLIVVVIGILLLCILLMGAFWLDKERGFYSSYFKEHNKSREL